MKDLFVFLIFPGFLFTAVAGMMASWLERKLTARIQWRVGPPWYQSFADILKLLGKETVIPADSSKPTFVLAPFLGLAATVYASGMLAAINCGQAHGFNSDLIALVCLLMVPSLSLAVGGAASRNALAGIGAKREIKLMAACIPSLILAMVTPLIRAGWTVDMGRLTAEVGLHGSCLWNWSCVLSFIAAILCMQAILGFTPFDTAEAETEIEAGPLTEYSGVLLAIVKLTKMMLLIVLPLFLLTLFTSGVRFHGWGIVSSAGRYLALLLVIIVIKNTNPRLRIDQAMKFFWGPVTIIAAAGIVLALLGH
jgi:NADH-quinone oxidoreductase subunit H